MMKQTTGERIFNAINLVLLGLLTIICILPFVYVIALSLSSSEAIIANRVRLLPVDFQLDAYKSVFTSKPMIQSLLFTSLLTVVGTAVNLVMTVCAAYPLSKKRLKGKKAILLFITFTMFFNGRIIPTFLVVQKLGLIDSMWALILPVAINTYNMFIVRTFFSSSIPDSIEEAAYIDGCSDIGTLLKIVLPMSLPILATIGLFYAVLRWNTFFGALIYINNPNKYTLQLKLRQLIMMDQLSDGMDEEALNIIPESIKSATIIFSTLPILFVYPRLQKYFAKGVMLGSIKG